MADPFFIQIRNLDLRNNKKSILRIDQAAIPIEKITCIIGENGSGKTSLLKLIAGLDKTSQACIDFPKLSTCMVHNQSTVLKMSVKENNVRRRLVKRLAKKRHACRAQHRPARVPFSGLVLSA